MYQQRIGSQRTSKILKVVPLVLGLPSRNCPLRKSIKQLFSSFLSLSFLFTMTFVPQILSKNFENLIFVFKLLTVSFCFSIFVVYLVMVKFFILFKYVICFCRQLCWILASIQKLMLSIRRKSAVILFLLSIQTCAACFFGKARQSLSWWSPSKHYISLFKNNHSSVKVPY